MSQTSPRDRVSHEMSGRGFCGMSIQTQDIQAQRQSIVEAVEAITRHKMTCQEPEYVRQWTATHGKLWAAFYEALDGFEDACFGWPECWKKSPMPEPDLRTFMQGPTMESEIA